jgi:exodeoxyribonuclease VII large subunit
VTIADFVADLRAATPSNAAELAVPDINEERDALAGMDIRARQAMAGLIKARRQSLGEYQSKRVLQNPKEYIDVKRQALDHAQDTLCNAARRKTSAARERFARLAASLDAMSPLKVLGRGYAIARKTDGSVVKAAADVKTGDRLTLRLQTDEIGCEVL